MRTILLALAVSCATVAGLSSPTRTGEALADIDTADRSSEGLPGRLLAVAGADHSFACGTSAPSVAGVAASREPGPQPGDVYREFSVIMTGREGWRVIDPQSPKAGARKHLRNPIHRLRIDDLQGAVRAEVVIDRWGGHVGTSNKRIRLNQQTWIELPELTTTPAGDRPECYLSQDNPVVNVPPGHLREGLNLLEGTSGDQIGCAKGWGQWGWYGAVVRVYYGMDKPHASGRIVWPRTGGTFGEYPTIRVEVSGSDRVSRVDVLAHYTGYDENGDGVFTDWHGLYRYSELRHHVGSAMNRPFHVVWDTRWVPDQAPKSVKLVARIRDAEGYWYVTPIVDKVTLQRQGTSVKFYPPRDVPSRYQVRVGREMSSSVHIPEQESLPRAVEAALHIRTWNGVDDNFAINGHQETIGGADHNFAYTVRPVPVSALKQGTNRISFRSETKAHSREISWPGPGLTVRYGRVPERPVTLQGRREDWLDADYAYRVPLILKDVGVDRTGLTVPVSVRLDFTRLLKALGRQAAIDPASVRMVGLNRPGSTVVKNVPPAWQFDVAPDYDPLTNARGTLTYLYGGPVGVGRAWFVYFGVRGIPRQSPMFEPQVTVRDAVPFQGQDSYQISTGAATYYYHKEGGGFASLQDPDGREWIGYKPGGRGEGEFRGIPNLGEVGHPGYTGERGVKSRLLNVGPIKAAIASESADGRWHWMWEIFPACARLSMLKAGSPYWFLYEGTPGGRLEPEKDFVVLSNGVRLPASERWSHDIPGPDWVLFGDPEAGRALFLAKHDQDDIVDQYYPMNAAMTVFGFGRQQRSPVRHLTGPGKFTVGLIGWTDFERARPVIEGTYREVVIEVGAAEAREK